MADCGSVIGRGSTGTSVADCGSVLAEGLALKLKTFKSASFGEKVPRVAPRYRVTFLRVGLISLNRIVWSSEIITSAAAP